MSTQMNITDEKTGKQYNLRYTRHTVKIIENMGFKLNELSTMLATMPSLLFYGAFLANYEKTITQKETDKILIGQKKNGSFWTTLVTMYCEPLKELIGDMNEDDDEDDEGNVNVVEITD